MGILDGQNRLKLDILQSLARSQRALAEIVEVIAPVVASSVHGTSSDHEALEELTTQQILAYLGSLSAYQHALAQKLSGIDIRQVKNGRPGKPWLAPTSHFLRNAE
jgi:poly-gamma-glutamate capsule biosynthesis protein CapA/YwtB (metallophosphatase superfamily)